MKTTMMNRVRNLSLKRIFRITKMLVQGRPRCFKLVRPLIENKKGLEIGGPSAVFRRSFNLPLYDYVFALDNCDFSKDTTWASHAETYCFSKRMPCGRTYFCEGSDLKDVPNGCYDFLLSSHNLEHLANPVKGLKEWQRVVKPGGTLVIVLPDYRRTFDHRRTPTTIEHMLDDYRCDMGEEDLTHMDETFQAHRLNDGPGNDDELRRLLEDNFNHRMMHHHVFDEINSKALLEAVGFDVLAVEMQLPFHIYLVAQTPK